MDKASFEIVGNVGKVELKDIKGGKKIAILSLATSERWKREDGEWAERTYWHRVAVFPPGQGRTHRSASAERHARAAHRPGPPQLLRERQGPDALRHRVRRRAFRGSGGSGSG